MVAPQILPHVSWVLLAWPAGRGAFESVDQRRDSHAWRVMHEKVDMVGLAVELAHLRTQVCADVGHEALAVGEQRVREDWASVFGDKD